MKKQARDVFTRALPFLFIVLVFLPPSSSGSVCEPLPPPAGDVISVTTVLELKSAINSAAPRSTILLADGIYALNGVYLWIDTPDLTLGSLSGNREAVILDGNYMTTVIITIVASNVTISDITLRRALYHPIHVEPPGGMSIVNTRIHNIHIIDPGEQGIKISSRSGYFADDGEIACSRIELTDAGRAKVIDCYTGGVSAHGAKGWVIRDNVIEGFWCKFRLSGHAILLWTGSRDTIVERNVLIDNARGIGFGFVQYGSGRTYDDDPCPDIGYVGHYGGIIRNNFVFQNREDLRDSEYGFNCGICLSQACGTKVLHNTVVSTAPPTSSIECRYPNTDATITNNLISRNFWVRDGASVTLAGNLDHQPLSLFIDGAGGDLHLAEHASAAVDQGTPIGDGLCVDDIDTDIRGFRPDVGADEIVKECVADLEGDGDVDGSDLAGFAADFNTTWNTSHLQSFAMELGLADCSD